uniref:Uncharacterized protein n=1 Tax=Rhizophora mucronata TaxID=61149 RepID=A0A2P2IXK0_RHIMU
MHLIPQLFVIEVYMGLIGRKVTSCAAS